MTDLGLMATKKAAHMWTALFLCSYRLIIQPEQELLQ